MRSLRKFLLPVMAVALFSLLVVPLTAQDAPGPSEGEPLILPNLGSDIAGLNPIINSADGSSAAVITRLYPNFLAVDHVTADFSTAAPGGIVTDYSISDDGLTYTFTLRDDWNWNDGTPVTSADYKYAFDAIASAETTTALTYVLDSVEGVEALDPQTVVVTLKSASCAALNNIAAVPIVPSHIYQAEFASFADMNESEFNLTAPVTAGAFQFSNFRPGEQVTLVANQDYPDAQLGYVVPEGWIYKNVASETLIWEQFKAGDLTRGQPPIDKYAEARELGANGEAQIFETPAGTIQFLSFNLGDPANPQSAFDDDGNPIDQGNHPVLGDVRVRQALMYAMDWTEINEKGMGGEGIQLASHVLPSSWAYDPDLAPYALDLEKADALLTEAGWVDDDNNPDTPRVAQGALYAEDDTPLAFKLETNAGNESNESIGVLLQAQWKEVGVDLDFQAIDFNVLIDNLLAQTYDASMIFWGFSTPDNPEDTRATFGPSNDVLGSGFNTGSYNNSEVTKLMDDALVVPGCDQAERAEIYHQVQALLREDVPWIWLGTSTVIDSVQPDIQNYDPGIGGIGWNENAWYPQP